jgi:HEAT repeat protein
MSRTTRFIAFPLTLAFVVGLASSIARGQSSERRGQRSTSIRSSRIPDIGLRTSDDDRDFQRADSVYRAAREALNDGDYTLAATLFKRVVDRDPKSSVASSALYYRAYALYRAGGSRNLANALTTLESLHDDYAGDYERLKGNSLRIQICGERARQGDEECASEVVREARSSSSSSSPSSSSSSSSSRSQSSRSCPREGDDNDDRVMALNALLQMNGEQALPILEGVLKKRDNCWELRKQATFLVSQKSGDRAADILMDVARNDPSSEVREQAVFWLGQTNSERAVDILSEILEKTNDVELQKKAVFSLTQNRSSRAQQIIRDVAQRENVSKDVRLDAIFWLGQRRDSDNAEFLRTLFRKTRDSDVKEKIIFSLSQQRSEGNGKWLLDVALDDRESVDIRKNALFWAGQSRMVDISDFSRLYDGNKDREIKEQIIFTLSQRRETEAVDKLMSIAKSDADKELRSKAIFWLGQSRDPRVAKFLEELINR